MGPSHELIMALTAQPNTQDACRIGSGPFPALLGVRKLGMEVILWSSNVSTKSPPPWPFSVILSPTIIPLSCLLPPKLSAWVDCCLGWVAQRSRASCCPSSSHHCRRRSVFIVLCRVIVPSVAVVVTPDAVVVPCRHAARRHRRAACLRHRAASPCSPSPLSCHLSPCCPLPSLCRPSLSSCHVIVPPVAFCVPWLPIGGIGPYQGTVASPMMYTLHGASALGCAKWGPTVWIQRHQWPWCRHVGNTMVVCGCGWKYPTLR